MVVLGRALLDIANLRLEAFERVAVHEVVVADRRRVLFGVVAVATLEDLRVRSSGPAQWLRLERVVLELVEIATVGEGILSPDALETLDELPATAVSLGVVEPPLSDAGELRKRISSCFPGSKLMEHSLQP